MLRSIISKRVQRPLVRAYSSAIVSEIEARGPWYYNEPLSTPEIKKLDASLADYIPPQKIPRTKGQLLPAGYHLLFHNNVSPESELSSDGYHKNQAPDEKLFPARMWLGGSVEFNHKAPQLLVGSLSSAKEEINSVSYKSKEVGDATVKRLDVKLDRFLYGSDLSSEQMMSDQWALKETRSLAYFSPEASSGRESTFTRFLKREY